MVCSNASHNELLILEANAFVGLRFSTACVKQDDFVSEREVMLKVYLPLVRRLCMWAIYLNTFAVGYASLIALEVEGKGACVYLTIPV